MKWLVCPYCGGALTINLTWQGRMYLQEQVPDTIECCAGDCQAEWSPTGVPIEPPAWERYPDVYKKPRRAIDRDVRKGQGR